MLSPTTDGAADAGKADHMPLFSRAKAADALQDPYLPGTGTPVYTVRHTDIDLDLDLGPNTLTGRVRLEGTMLQASRRVVLDLHRLSVSAVTATSGGRTVRLAKTTTPKDRLVIDLEDALPGGAELTLTVHYHGTPTLIRGLWGEVGWEELEDGVLVAGQPNGACTWFPCVDHPSVKSSYRVSVSTDAGYLPVASGVPAGHTRASSRQRHTWDLAQPVSSYLATVQIARYRLVELPAGRADVGLPPMFLAVTKDLKRTAREALGVQTEMMACFIRHYGPYPYERYTAVVTDDELEIPLEAASLSIFGANHLGGSWEAERLVAHEMAHQWFGNALTVRRWQDIWLHEGFASFSEWLWGSDSGRGSLQTYAARAWQGLRRPSQNLVIADPGPESMFDDRVYQRGALALYAMRQALGADVFGELLRSWVASNLHGTVDTPMFLQHADAVAASAGLGLSAASDVLRPWLFEKGLPPLPG